MVRALLAANPDSSRLADKVRMMEACVRDGPARVNWRAEAQKDIPAVLGAGTALAVGGARLDCAMPALAEVVRADTTRIGDDRWFALFQLQGLLLTQGRTADAVAQVDARPESDEASTMYLLDGLVFPSVAERADGAARKYEQQCGPRFTGCANSYRLWELALWAAHRGRSAVADAMARELAARTQRAGSAEDVMVGTVLANSAAAHAALARSDTATAFELLQSLVLAPVPGGVDIDWNVALPRGFDRLVLARLLVIRGQARRAISVADVFDSSSPAVHLIYLSSSLELRAQAAEALGEPALAARYRARLSALGTLKTLATRAGSLQ